jgi:type II secretion system protein G
MKFTKTNKGFTLIELMVVIAIIAILSGIIITSLTQSKSKSRDAERVSDLNQIQLALEQYFDRCGQYPADIYSATPASCSSGVSFADYISKVPKDPSTGNNYDYAINTTNPSLTPATDYILHTKLENQNTAQVNSYPESSRAAIVNSTWSGSTSFNCYGYSSGGSTSSPTPSISPSPTTSAYPSSVSSSYLNDYCISTK